MATGFALWFCLVGLYVVESLRLMSVRSLLYRPAVLGGGSEGAPPNTYPGNGRWAWTVLPLWPARELTLTCQQSLLAWGKDAFGPNVIFLESFLPSMAYGDVRTTSVDEKTLSVNGRKFVKCESESEAKRARDLLERLKALTPAKREATIRLAVKDGFSSQAVLQRLNQVRCATRQVRLLSGVLWWVLVILFPFLLLVLRVPDAFVILPVAGVTVLLAVAIAVAFAMGAERLYPTEKVGYRWKSVKFVLYPVSALRAADELALDAISGAHPAVLSVLLGRGERQIKELKTLWQQARRPVPMSVHSDPGALAASLWFNELLCAEMKAYLKSEFPAALEEEQVQPLNAGSLSYCPNCRAQYVTKVGTCADCQGLALRPFSDVGETTRP